MDCWVLLLGSNRSSAVTRHLMTATSSHVRALSSPGANHSTVQRHQRGFLPLPVISNALVMFNVLALYTELRPLLVNQRAQENIDKHVHEEMSKMRPTTIQKEED